MKLGRHWIGKQYHKTTTQWLTLVLCIAMGPSESIIIAKPKAMYNSSEELLTPLKTDMSLRSTPSPNTESIKSLNFMNNRDNGMKGIWFDKQSGGPTIEATPNQYKNKYIKIDKKEMKLTVSTVCTTSHTLVQRRTMSLSSLRAQNKSSRKSY